MFGLVFFTVVGFCLDSTGGFLFVLVAVVGLWGLLLLVWFFVFVDFVCRYNLTKGQMTSSGHFENPPAAAQLLQYHTAIHQRENCIYSGLPRRFILSINLCIWTQRVWVNNHGATKSISRLFPNVRSKDKSW